MFRSLDNQTSPKSGFSLLHSQGFEAAVSKASVYVLSYIYIIDAKGIMLIRTRPSDGPTSLINEYPTFVWPYIHAMGVYTHIGNFLSTR